MLGEQLRETTKLKETVLKFDFIYQIFISIFPKNTQTFHDVNFKRFLKIHFPLLKLIEFIQKTNRNVSTYDSIKKKKICEKSGL